MGEWALKVLGQISWVRGWQDHDILFPFVRGKISADFGEDRTSFQKSLLPNIKRYVFSVNISMLFDFKPPHFAVSTFRIIMNEFLTQYEQPRKQFFLYIILIYWSASSVINAEKT